MLTLRAPAKINLSLEVIGKRADGFHDLISVVQSVTLFDVLTLEDAEGISFRCTEPSLAEENIVQRATELTRKRFGVSRGVSLNLMKSIPVAAGLGGGSSDAAATLVGLDQLWGLSATREQLLELAAILGSDVPYFLYGGTALVTGRGERISTLSDTSIRWYLLANPGFEVSTRSVFNELKSDEWTSGQLTRKTAEEIQKSTMAPIGFNGLANAMFRLYPDAATFFQKVDSLAPGRTFVSGSGPTVVAVFSNEEDAIAAQRSLSDCNCRTFVAATLPAGSNIHA